MAENKKSFLLYVDTYETVKHLTDKQAGELFKLILSYVNDENPEPNSALIKIAFEPIKQSLKRDLKKYQKKQNERSKSGILGNLKRYNIDLYNKVSNGEMTIQEAQNLAKSRKTSHSDTKLAVSDSDSVSDNDIDITTIDEYIKKLSTQEIYLEGLYRTHGLVKGSLSTIALSFKEHLKVFPKEHNNFNDFKRHFASWINLQVQKGKFDKHLKQQKGML